MDLVQSSKQNVDTLVAGMVGVRIRSMVRTQEARAETNAVTWSSSGYIWAEVLEKNEQQPATTIVHRIDLTSFVA